MNTPNKKQLPRAVIYPTDISHITGMKTDTARKLLRKIRIVLHKPERSFITIREFCYVTGLEEEFVAEFIQ